MITLQENYPVDIIGQKQHDNIEEYNRVMSNLKLLVQSMLENGKDAEDIAALAWNIKRGIQWDKIFLLSPKNTFVDDGCRYMKQSTMDERTKNYNILVQLLKDFGWWDKVEIINGNFLENFNSVKNYVESKMGK